MSVREACGHVDTLLSRMVNRQPIFSHAAGSAPAPPSSSLSFDEEILLDYMYSSISDRAVPRDKPLSCEPDKEVMPARAMHVHVWRRH